MSQLCTSFQADQLNVAGDWEDRFRVEYAALSLKHSKRRRARKSGKRRRVDQEAADHSDELLFRDIAIDRAVRDGQQSRCDWRRALGGGAEVVGGNPL